MNTYLLPRPSLRGAILWQRAASALAVIPSGRVLGWSILCVVLGLQLLLVPPARSLVTDYWVLVAGALALLNVASCTLVGVGNDGVTVRRAVTGFKVDGKMPLGGQFRRTPVPRHGETDLEQDDDVDDEGGSRSLVYALGDKAMRFTCVFPAPTAQWLDDQVRRVEQRAIATARMRTG